MQRLFTTIILTGFSACLHAQQVGIGTTSPQAQLHVAEGSVIFTNTGDVTATPSATSLGTGRRMMWYSDKAAFRAGYTVAGNTSMHMDSIGNYSTAFGRNNKVKGTGSFGSGNTLDVKGNYAAAFGQQCNATGNFSFAAGYEGRAWGNCSVAMGFNTDAYGQYATAFGSFNDASGDYSTAMGQGCLAQAANSTAIGWHVAARGFGSTVVGTYNQPIIGAEQQLSYGTPLFIVGNGVDDSHRENAMVVRRWGGVGIGTDDPQVRLHVVGGTDATLLERSGYLVIGNTYSTNIVMDNNEIMARNGETAVTLYLQNGGGALETGGTASKPGGGSWTATSDARLKENIEPYTDGLAQLKNINPVYYHYNQQSGYDTKRQHIGVIAQEMQKIAPYMVGSFKKEDKEYLNVDNSAMTYMLINAVKEQQKEIEELKELVKKLLAK